MEHLGVKSKITAFSFSFEGHRLLVGMECGSVLLLRMGDRLTDMTVLCELGIGNGSMSGIAWNPCHQDRLLCFSKAVVAVLTCSHETDLELFSQIDGKNVSQVQWCPQRPACLYLLQGHECIEVCVAKRKAAKVLVCADVGRVLLQASQTRHELETDIKEN